MNDFLTLDLTPDLFNSVVTCYAPTEEAEKEKKDNFYDSLQSTLEDVPKHDVLVVLGDFNARVGSDNTDRERIMGKHGTSTMTDNGTRLCYICGKMCATRSSYQETVHSSNSTLAENTYDIYTRGTEWCSQTSPRKESTSAMGKNC